MNVAGGRVLLMILGLTLATAAAGCATAAQNEGRPTMVQLATTEAEFQLMQARLAEAYREMARGDIDRLMQLYLPDALIQSPGAAPMAGTEAIRAFWLETFERYQVDISPQVQEVTVFGDILVVRGRAVGVFTPRNGGQAAHIDSWFMQIYRRPAAGAPLFWRGANGPNP